MYIKLYNPDYKKYNRVLYSFSNDDHKYENHIIKGLDNKLSYFNIIIEYNLQPNETIIKKIYKTDIMNSEGVLYCSDIFNYLKKNKLNEFDGYDEFLETKNDIKTKIVHYNYGVIEDIERVDNKTIRVCIED